MISNNSGKFATSASKGVGEDSTRVQELSLSLPQPPADKSIALFIEEYFGRLWWLWLVVLIFKIYRS